MRPIDADKFLARLHQYEDFECPATDTAFKAVSQVRSLLWDEPIITLDDLRPKGRWKAYKPDSRGYTCGFICSSCSAVVYTDYSQRDCVYDYCPNCGADMRGGDTR